ncbi:MAG TPA: hypothetical protein VMV49_14120 [Candidatus Deferrimicrobium sp.]|nr:hypothetical protein [Candidatus Deferrimicrobium sp.]
MQIDRSRRLNKPIKTYTAQKTSFLEELSTNPKELRGIARVKNSIAFAFSEIVKKEKEIAFWRIIVPDVRKILPESEFTTNKVLDMEFPTLDATHPDSSPPQSIVLAVKEFDAGKVVVMSSPSPFIQKSGIRYGLYSPDHLTLTSNIFNWLHES